MDPRTLRRTVIGAAGVGGLFALVGIAQAVWEGAPMPGALQPIAVFTLIGVTVGALTGPLVGGALARLFGGKREDSSPPERE